MVLLESCDLEVLMVALVRKGFDGGFSDGWCETAVEGNERLG